VSAAVDVHGSGIKPATVRALNLANQVSHGSRLIGRISTAHADFRGPTRQTAAG